MQSHWMKRSISARLVIVGALVLILMIPAAMVGSLIRERQERRDEAVLEVSEKWGYPQTLLGPVLSIPYTYYFKNSQDQMSSGIAYAHFLPETLTVTGDVAPQIRKRGIYEIVLFATDLQVSGIFGTPLIEQLKIPLEDYLWDDAFLSVGITDMKGLRELITCQVNGEIIPAESGLESKDVLSSGVTLPLHAFRPEERLDFAFELKLNGSKTLAFCPVGKETHVMLSSDWIDPSFMGSFLPSSHEISKSGFQAEWKVLHLNRNFPQQWLGNLHKLDSAIFGVSLLVPVDEYQKNMRTAKYAFMFIGLTFLSFFMTELLNKKLIHPIQYLLIGFALLVFYTLLLSFSEHMLFKYAYLLASLATITLITTYTEGMLKDRRQTLIIAGILVFLYAYLYIVLQLQELALLIGSIGLFCILSLVMYLTRKIDWFNVLQVVSPPDKTEETR